MFKKSERKANEISSVEGKAYDELKLCQKKSGD
jgi:hypothetical protein